MKVSRKVLVLVISLTMALSGCGLDKEETSDLAKDITPKPKSSSTANVTKKESHEVTIDVLERVYESKAGVQLTSKYQFASMLNNNTTFQLEYAELDDAVVVRVDNTDFYPVDFERLSSDEKLFTDMIAPKNAERNGAMFSVEGQVAMLKYKTGSPPNLKYCVSAVVFTGEEILKVYTESAVDYYTDVLHTFKRVQPKSNESYKLVVQEIDKLSFKDIAINVPFNAHDKWEVHSEGTKIKVSENDSEYIELFYSEGLTAQDYPKPDAIGANLGWSKVEYAEDFNEETNIYVCQFSDGEDKRFGVVTVPIETGLYIATAEGAALVPYLVTLRGKTAPDIYSKNEAIYTDTTVAIDGVIQETVKLNDLQFSVPKGAEVNQVNDTYTIKYSSDDYFQVGPATRLMTNSTIKKDSLDIRKSTVEGDHFVAVANDGSTYYYRQYEVDGKLWNIKAIGVKSIGIAKSAKVADDYVYFKDRDWQRMQRDKATFMVPSSTSIQETDTSIIYTFPSGGRLTFTVTKKLPTIKDLPNVVVADETIFYQGSSPYIGVKLTKQYQVTCTDAESKEALYSLRVGK